MTPAELNETPKRSLKFPVIIFVNAKALLLGALIVTLCIYLEPEGTEGKRYIYVNLLVALLGGVLGWFIGTLASPYDKSESSRFLSLAQAASAFATGYLVSKIDKFFDITLYSENNTAINTVAWERVGLFAASLMVMALIVYINRAYYHDAMHPNVQPDQPPSPKIRPASIE